MMIKSILPEKPISDGILTFMKILLLLIATLCLHAADLSLDVLGSGGPEIDGRASTSYVLWIDGEAKALIDMGSGSMLRFEQSKAKLETLEAVLLTHLHIDHAVDLPSFVKAGYFSKRTEPLSIVGPKGNGHFPGTADYLRLLFGEAGAYRYMQDVLTRQSESFQVKAVEIDAPQPKRLEFESFSVEVINVHHGIVPALAFKITAKGKSVLISGDTSNQKGALERLALDSDLLIAHHAIGEEANPYAKRLHMTPTIIGKVAKAANAKTLVLSHRMNRTLGKETQSLNAIRNNYKGEIVFAEDRMRIDF